MDKILIKGTLWASSWKPQKYFFRLYNVQSWVPSEMIYSKDLLELQGLGTYYFLNEDIVSIDLYKLPSIYFLWNNKFGIKINSTVKKYPEYIIFVPNEGDSEDLINKIKSTGFLNKNNINTDKNFINKYKKLQRQTPWIFIFIAIVVILFYGIIVFTDFFVIS